MSHEIRIHDKPFKPFITFEQIAARIKVLSAQINVDYEGERPLFLAVLNGSFMFAADLLKEISIECDISFVKLSSYDGLSSTGTVKSLIGMDEDIEGRHVLILEDIVDTGKTLVELILTLDQKQPASIATVSLLVKPEAIEHNIDVEYTGFEIPNAFIVGYGLDYDGLGRNLKDIYQIID